MAIVGSFAECRPERLLQIIAQGRKTGRLTVQGGNRAAECYFRDGRLDLVRSPEACPMLDALAAAGLITAEQCASLKPYSAQGERSLLARLGELGYVEPPRALSALRQHTTEHIRTIFRWDRGTFRLDEGVDPPEDSLGLAIDLTALLAGSAGAPSAAAVESGAAAPAASAPAAPKSRRWWSWLRGGKDDRRQ